MWWTWEVIGTKKHRENIPEFVKQNGNTITGALEIAEGFNSFFAGISPELAGSITITPSNINLESFLGPETEEDFIFAHVTPETLNKIEGKLKTKNSSGNDNNISTKLIILPSIINPLCYMFNLSLQTGYVPTQFKTAKVVPIFKGCCAKNQSTQMWPNF